MENILFDFISKYISLSEDEKKAMVSLDIFRTFKKGTILLKEGQYSVDGYFVLKGCLRTYYIIDGEEKQLNFILKWKVSRLIVSIISNHLNTLFPVLKSQF